MAKKLKDRINNIINDRSFNELPIEQRKFICKFLAQHQILTLYQAINNYPELVCGAYKAKIRNWLENCVDSYEKEYSTPKKKRYEEVKNIEFKFELNKEHMTHLKDKSCYNHNYYVLDLSRYGDYIIPEKCNILYQESEDDSYSAYYSLGYFDGNGKFQAMWTWLDNWHCDL